jgi:hypothetical protein
LILQLLGATIAGGAVGAAAGADLASMPITTTTGVTPEGGVVVGAAAPPIIQQQQLQGQQFQQGQQLQGGYYGMQSFYQGQQQPQQNAFPYILNLRFSHAELRGLAAGIRLIAVKIKCGGIEARTDRLLDAYKSERWNLSGDIPLANPMTDIIEVDLLDASAFQSRILPGTDASKVTPAGGMAAGGGMGMGGGQQQGLAGQQQGYYQGGRDILYLEELWNRSPIIGRVGIRVNTLLDGHESLGNQLRLDNGTVIFCDMRLFQSQAGGSGVSGASSGLNQFGNYNWQQSQQQVPSSTVSSGQASGIKPFSYWEFNRQQVASSTSSGIGGQQGLVGQQQGLGQQGFGQQGFVGQQSQVPGSASSGVSGSSGLRTGGQRF